ncbi:DUF4190 domain-containing protein [Georgenia faecalis]|uniref:DUF4190 domain-containing protein n=1 Tax=Georgenia faecalis TaxID=2483799 RepID=UPI000FDCCD87|nr:DUF4190 domain-containing protein [Georgenia faecalis]
MSERPDPGPWAAPGRGPDAAGPPAPPPGSAPQPGSVPPPGSPWATSPPPARPGPPAPGAPLPHARPAGPPYAPYEQPPAPFAVDEADRARVFAQAGYTSAGLHNDGTAVAAMIVGVAGILVPGLCLVAIALGHLARRRLQHSYAGGGGLAVTGIALGYVGLALWLAVLVGYLVVRQYA